MGRPQEQLMVVWNQIEKKVIDAVEDYLERCAQVIEEIDLVESLLRPEKLEVSLRYVLKHATCRSSNIFQLFDTSEKPNHFVASRIRWLESQGRDVARQENGRNEWCDLGYQGAKAKLRRAPTALYRLLCLSKARRRQKKRRSLGSDGRTAKAKDCLREPGHKGMLTYLDNCNDVKVGHH